MSSVLKFAGIYNLLFGIWVIGWPGAWFSISGMEPPRYPFLWQCVGMIVGVYGLGYVIAAFSPLRHWEPMAFEQAVQRFRLTSGETLQEASEKEVLAVVFLRHFGCTFTRQLLMNLREMHERAEEKGARLVLVHMLQEGEEAEFVDTDGVSRIADPRWS